MRYISVWLGLIILTAAIAMACATPEPIPEEIEVTVEVTQIVPQTVEVPTATLRLAATPRPGATLRPAASIIKKSRSGICNPPGGAYYSRTLNYTPYATMEECLASGGQRPLR